MLTIVGFQKEVIQEVRRQKADSVGSSGVVTQSQTHIWISRHLRWRWSFSFFSVLLSGLGRVPVCTFAFVADCMKMWEILRDENVHCKKNCTSPQCVQQESLQQCSRHATAAAWAADRRAAWKWPAAIRQPFNQSVTASQSGRQQYPPLSMFTHW